MFSKFDIVGFFSNIVAIILGIVITFSIQGLIDKKKEREDVKASLVLVRDELMSCYQDLSDCADIMDLEVTGAKYILKNIDSLKYCCKDSINIYGKSLLFMNFLSLPNDAMELLKSSSLFAKIEDPALSLQIIKAYDYCNVLHQVFETHEKNKTDVMSNNVPKALLKMLKDGEIVSLEEFGKEESSRLIVEFIAQNNESMSIRRELPKIKSTIDQIDEYIQK